MKRRSFLLGIAGILAAPAIVRADILMPVKKVVWPASRIIVPMTNGVSLIQGIAVDRDNTYWIFDHTKGTVVHVSSDFTVLSTHPALGHSFVDRIPEGLEK